MSFTEKYSILCDEVRREDNGKAIFIGVYFNTITVPQIPLTMPSLTLFMLLDASRAGISNFRTTLSHMETGRVILQAGGIINVPMPGVVGNGIRCPNVSIIAPGSYQFATEIEGCNSPFIMSFDVILQIPGVNQPLLAGIRQ
jgi:hypothetical protein